MKATAIRFNGETLKKETYDLPAMKDDEIVAKVICDTLCLSTYKAIKQGKEHMRIPKDIGEKPIIIGHEFCGEILQVGAKWKDSFQIGQRFIIQPALNYKGSPAAPGYSYQYIGGDATYIIIPNEVMETGSLLNYDSDSPFFAGSLAEPLSCIVGGFKKMVHTKPGVYTYYNNIKEGGYLAILGGAGPMGIATIGYAINSNIKPKAIVIVENVEEKLRLAEKLAPISQAAAHGVELHYVLSKDAQTVKEELMQITNGNGFDDVFVYAAVKPLMELGDSILAYDGCLNLFAGPYDKEFKSEINFYNVHYKSTHMVGLSGGTTQDMIEYVDLVGQNKINPSALITHIGGLDSVIEAVQNLPQIPGGKKLIYTHFNFPLTEISKIGELKGIHPVFEKLDLIVKANNGLWTKEAEDCLLQIGNI